MARIALFAPDLFFAAKIQETLTSAGHEVAPRSTIADLANQAELLIVDLDALGERLPARDDVPVLAFYSHVDVEARRRAEAAGYDLVVPRSKMAREMPDLVARLVSG